MPHLYLFDRCIYLEAVHASQGLKEATQFLKKDTSIYKCISPHVDGLYYMHIIFNVQINGLTFGLMYFIKKLDVSFLNYAKNNSSGG